MAGDLRAFETLYARHKGPLYRYLLRHTRDRALADDLFQETWGRLIGARQRYEPAGEIPDLPVHARPQPVHRPLPPRERQAGRCLEPDARWPSRTTMTAPAASAPSAAIPAPEPDNPSAAPSSRRSRSRIRAALDALPREQRDVFLLYEETGLSLEEIAQVTGVGPETAKSRLRYAVAKLRASMADLAPAALPENAS